MHKHDTSTAHPDAARQPRIFRVHGSNYHHDEVLQSPDTHTDERLANIAAMGYDGVWLHGNLKWLAPTALFAPYVDLVPQRLAALNQTIARAARHGIGVWLYLNEPRGLPKDHPFFTQHPDCAGHLLDNTRWDLGWPWPHTRQPCRCLCLSAAPVMTFLRDATAALLQAAPQLAGIITITNSEHPTHCYSKIIKGTTQCPRCADRPRVEMPTAVLTAMHQGLRASSTTARLAAWTWSWASLAPDPQPTILAALPPDIALIVDFERGQPVNHDHIHWTVDEYAFSITGPSQRFETYRQAAADRPVWAKLQIGATHELATMPNIPAIATLRDKIVAMRKLGVSGALTTWTMGLEPTANSFAAGRLLAATGQLPSLVDLAIEYFNVDPATAQIIATGWRGFSDAIRYFPTTMAMCYRSPINYAPAYVWKYKRQGTPMARSWTPEPWGDRLEDSLNGLTMSQTALLLGRVAADWQAALPAYAAALDAVANERAAQERRVAQACGLFYQSCANAYRFADAVDRGVCASLLRSLMADELAVCHQAAALLDADDRLGWHDDFGYMITPQRIAEKITSLEQLIESAEPG